MSVYVTAYVWEHSSHGDAELLLLLAIADIANKEGVAFPSVSTLGRYIRMSDRHVSRLLRRLEASGELAVRVNEGPKGTNLFQIRMRQNLPLFSPDKLSTEGGDKLSPDKSGGDTGGQKVVTESTKSSDTAMSPEPSTNQTLYPEHPVDKSESRPLRSLAVQEFHAQKAKKDAKRAQQEKTPEPTDREQTV